MALRYDTVVALSDQTSNNATEIASITLGASIIEKHVTLDRNGGGLDDGFSLEPPQLKALCRDARTAWAALGRPNYERKSSEQENVKFRRSLYFVKDLKAGEKITPDAVRSVRPGYGLQRKCLPDIIGLNVKVDVAKGTPVCTEHISWT